MNISVDLLDCCDSIDDAKLILQFSKDNQTDRSYVTKFPRIEDALKCSQEKVIGHDYCQQILREAWHSSSRSRNVVQFQISHTADIILYSISSLVLMPIHVVGFLFMGCYKSKGEELNNGVDEKEKKEDFERAEEKCVENNDVDEKEKRKEKKSNSLVNVLKECSNFFSYPVNRCISQSGMYLLFTLALMFIGAIQRQDDFDDLNNWDFLIFIMSLGFVVPDIKLFLRGSPSWWPFFNSLGLSIVLVSLVCRFIDRILDHYEYFNIMNQEKFDKVFEEIQYCLFCFGIMMMVLRTFYYLAMSKNLGIIATSFVSIIGDIFRTNFW